MALLPVLGLLLLVLWMGFWQNGPGEPIIYTTSHYRKIFTDAFTYKTFLNTVGFATTAVLVALFFAIPLAWLVERTSLPGKSLILAIVTLGALLPTFFTAMGWVFLLHPRIGIINRFLMDTFGLAQAPLNVASIVGMGWVEGLGLSSIAFVMIVATYRSMDPSLEEAARVHGLGIFRTLVYVTLPLTFPGILAASIYVFTIALSAFEVPAIIGMAMCVSEGGPRATRNCHAFDPGGCDAIVFFDEHPDGASGSGHSTPRLRWLDKPPV